MEAATLLVLAALAVALFVVLRKVLAHSPFQGKSATMIAVCVAILCVIALSRFLGIGSTSSSAATTPATQQKGDGLGFLLLPYAALAIAICFLVLLMAAQKMLKRRSGGASTDANQNRRGRQSDG